MVDSIFQNPGLELLGEQNQSLKFMNKLHAWISVIAFQGTHLSSFENLPITCSERSDQLRYTKLQIHRDQK